MKNTTQAIKRLLEAKAKNEKIGIWGDYDPDGVCSTVLLYETLLKTGFSRKNLFIVLPHLLKFGRAFNPRHLQFLKDNNVSLIAGVDFGTSDFKGVNMAVKMGFDIILLDHHLQLPGKLSAILVNPKQKGDSYPYKNWSAVGVVYKFLESFYKYTKLNIKDLEQSLDLVAIGMMTDRIKIDRGNSPYLAKGLKLINQKKRLGVETLLKIAGFKKVDLAIIRNELTDYFGAQKGNNDQNNVFRLLTAEHKDVAQLIARSIHKHVSVFRAVVQKSIKQGINIFSKKPNLKVILWERTPKMVGAVSTIAEKLNEYFKMPVFIYEKVDGLYRGSIRANYLKSPNTNVVEVLKSCSRLLISFGGHPAAAGFKLTKDNLDEFKKAIQKYYE